MVTISLCMIVKNEEEVLGRCLESIKDAVDEIIIVDTGSDDKTKEIASSFGCKVYDFEWIEDFSAARNFAYSKAQMDYQMWLDADDVVNPVQKQKLLELKRTLTLDTDMVTMKYDISFDTNGNVLLSSVRERLTKRENGYVWNDPVHECIPMKGNIFYSDIRITHLKPKKNGDSLRNLKIYEKLERTNAIFTPRQLYYFARELFDHTMYPKAIYYFEKFLDSGKGWNEDNIAACFNLYKCYTTLKDDEKILAVLLRSFRYDSPRPEICCSIGYYYKSHEDYKIAAKWFKTAIHAENSDSLGFVQKDYSGYIPNLELCVCYYKLGDLEKAIYHNEAAGEYKNNDKTVMDNKAFLNNDDSLAKLVNQ